MAEPTHINRLPNEVFCLINDYLFPQDILNLRKVSKRISETADKAFIRNNIAERRHVLSKHSLNTLEAITGHHRLGQGVQSIMFNSALSIESEDQFGENNKETLTRVFTHIKRWGTKVSLGVSDVHTKDGQIESFHGADTINLTPADQYPHQSPERVLRFALDCATEGFACKTGETEISACKIGEIKMVLSLSDRCNCSLGKAGVGSLFSLISTQLSSFPDMGFQFHVFAWQPQLWHILAYDARQGSISIQNMQIGKLEEPPMELVHEIIRVSLENRIIRHLSISDSGIARSQWYRENIIQPHHNTLESIDLHFVRLSRRRHWGSDIKLLSTIPNLKQCSLMNLETFLYDPQDTEEQHIAPNSLVDGHNFDALKFSTQGSEVSKALRAVAEFCSNDMEKEIRTVRSKLKREWLMDDMEDWEEMSDNELFNYPGHDGSDFESELDAQYHWRDDSDQD